MRVTMIAAAALALLAGAAVPTGADPPPDLKIVPVGVPAVDSGPPEVGSQQPPITVQADFGTMPGAAGVQCEVDLGAGGPYTPCGTQVTTGCPVSQCWTYRPSLTSDGDHQMYVELVDAAGNELDTLGFKFVVDSTLPDTTLTSGPAFDNSHITRAGIPYEFRYALHDDADSTLYEDSDECAVTTGTVAPATWRPCQSGGKLARLPVTTQVYRYWVRAVDFLGRPDPTPAESAPFSPVPCHAKLARRAGSLRRIIRRGLRLRITCVQPGKVDAVLQLPKSELIRLNRTLRDVTAQELGEVTATVARQGGSSTVTLHTLRGIPRDLVNHAHLTLQIATTQRGAGTSYIDRVR